MSSDFQVAATIYSDIGGKKALTSWAHLWKKRTATSFRKNIVKYQGVTPQKIIFNIKEHQKICDFRNTKKSFVPNN